MIHSLRRWHRRAFLILAPLLPLIIGIGITARPKAPLVAALPELTSVPDQPTELIAIPELKLRLRIDTTQTGKDKGAIWAIPQDEVNEPDLLLYWDESESTQPQLGANAVLIGAPKVRQVRRLRIPLAVPAGGRLVLVSNPGSRVLAAVPWDDVQRRAAK